MRTYIPIHACLHMCNTGTLGDHPSNLQQGGGGVTQAQKMSPVDSAVDSAVKTLSDSDAPSSAANPSNTQQSSLDNASKIDNRDKSQSPSLLDGANQGGPPHQTASNIFRLAENPKGTLTEAFINGVDGSKATGLGGKVADGFHGSWNALLGQGTNTITGAANAVNAGSAAANTGTAASALGGISGAGDAASAVTGAASGVSGAAGAASGVSGAASAASTAGTTAGGASSLASGISTALTSM